MSNLLEDCSLGREFKEPCHRTSFRKTTGLLMFSDLSDTDQYLLKNRTGIHLEPNKTICLYHKGEILTRRFENHQTCCCDPFEKHLHQRRKRGLRIITVEEQKYYLNTSGIDLICGKKLCRFCRGLLSKKCKEKTKMLTCVEDMSPYSHSTRHRTVVSEQYSPIEPNILHRVIETLEPGEDAGDFLSVSQASSSFLPEINNTFEELSSMGSLLSSQEHRDCKKEQFSPLGSPIQHVNGTVERREVSFQSVSLYSSISFPESNGTTGKYILENGNSTDSVLLRGDHRTIKEEQLVSDISVPKINDTFEVYYSSGEEDPADNAVEDVERAFGEFQRKYQNVLNFLEKRQLKRPEFAQRKLTEIRRQIKALLNE